MEKGRTVVSVVTRRVNCVLSESGQPIANQDNILTQNIGFYEVFHAISHQELIPFDTEANGV